jgi:lysophospholipase L1-like esterase
MNVIRNLSIVLLAVGWISVKAFGVDNTNQPAQTFSVPAIADASTYLDAISVEMEKDWPANHTINLVCHGHSVPAGYARTPEVRTFDAYPYLLHRGLSERFPHAVINVIVTAIGGEQSEQGAARFERDVLSLRPEVVTIDYALNDRRIGLTRAEKAWRLMIEAALNAHVKVILLTPTGDLSVNLDNPDDPLNQHAAQICRLAAEYHVGLADSLGAFKKYAKDGGKLADLMAQANHPDRNGHELVAAQLLKWFPVSR